MTIEPKILIFDTETCGIDPEHYPIWQIAGMIYQGDKLLDWFNFWRLVKLPEFQGTLEFETYTTSDISPISENVGTSEANLYYSLRRILNNHIDNYDKSDKLITIEYNAPFDTNMLRAMFVRALDKYFGAWFMSPGLCAMRIVAERLYKDRLSGQLVSFQLKDVCTFLDVNLDHITPISKFHDALFDTISTAHLLHVLEHPLAPSRVVLDELARQLNAVTAEIYHESTKNKSTTTDTTSETELS